MKVGEVFLKANREVRLSVEELVPAPGVEPGTDLLITKFLRKLTGSNNSGQLIRGALRRIGNYQTTHRFRRSLERLSQAKVIRLCAK